MEDYSDRISELGSRLHELLSRNAVTIREIRQKKPPEFNVEGVYVISAPSGEPIWVGRTKVNMVIGRLQNHLTKNQTSDLRVVLKRHPEYPQDADRYLVRCMEIVDARERAFFESFLIGILRPVFNKQ
jgi:hypothetical protein